MHVSRKCFDRKRDFFDGSGPMRDSMSPLDGENFVLKSDSEMFLGFYKISIFCLRVLGVKVGFGRIVESVRLF